MKKFLSLVAMAFLLTYTASAFAAQPGTPEYQKMKEYKKAKRAERESAAKNPSANAKGFWAKEAERSGFAGTGAMFGNAFGTVLPLDKPNSRKEKN